MANLLANTYTSGAQYGFYLQGASYDFSPTYWHYKTNIALSTYVMVMIEAIGYSYGSGNPIRCAWTFYSYSYIAQASVQNMYSGLSADGVYVSSDNYVCIRATGSSYFSGWVFNATTLAAGSGTVVSFTAASRNANTGNYY
jgi:hypothetical protein